MNYEKLKQFRFWDACDESLTGSRYSGERRNSLYPSESGVTAIDPKTKKAEVLGTCFRKGWYRLMGVPQSDPTTIKSEYIFSMGRAIENMITDLVKLTGLYNNSSVKFWDKSNYVSGEIDIVVNLPVDKEGHYIFTEVKSTWGGRLVKGFESGSAQELFDRPKGRGKSRAMVKGKPKDQNLLQLLTYLYTERDDPKLIGGKLVYFLRDNCNRTEFDVSLVEEKGKTRAMVNGVVDKRFYVEDIYARFAHLREQVGEDIKKLKSGVPFQDIAPPDRDFSLQYTAEEAKEAFDDGKVSKTKYEDFTSEGKPISDWQCQYCSWKTTCWAIQVAAVEEEEVSIAA